MAENLTFGVLKPEYLTLVKVINKGEKRAERKFVSIEKGRKKVYSFSDEEWMQVETYFTKTDHAGRPTRG